MKRWLYLVVGLLLLGCEVTEAPKPAREEKFVPPEDGRITEKMMNRYINASRYLLETIMEHERSIDRFIEQYGLSESLSELADSVYRKANKDVVDAWDQLTKDWGESEKNAYKKAGITEEEFNWIGGALTDPLNKDIQEKIAEELKAIELRVES